MPKRVDINRDRNLGRFLWPACFVLLAVCAYAGKWMVSVFAWPYLLGHGDQARLTPVFQQTFALRYLTLEYFALFSLLFAALLAWRPFRIWNGRILLAGVLLAAILLRWATPEMALDSIIRPDAVHFGVTAEQLVGHGAFKVPTGTALLPPRTLPGASLIMGLTQWVRPDHPGAGIYALFLCSALSIFLAFLLGRRIASPAVGVMASLLLALSPLHGYHSRQLMSDVTWGLFVLAAVYLLLAPGFRRRTAFAGGLLLGLAGLFKSSELLIAAGALAGLAWLVLKQKRGSGRVLGFAALGLAAGFAPVLFYNRLVLGGWLATPYHLYWPGWASMSQALGLKYLWAPPIIKGSMGNLPCYLLSFLGFDLRPERMMFALPVALLMIASLFVPRRPPTESPPVEKSFWILSGLISLLYGGACLLYSFQDPRFLLPIFPLWAVAAAVPVTRLVKVVSPEVRKACLAFCFLALLALGAGILQVETSALRIHERVLWERVAAAARPCDVLVSDEDPVLLTRYGAWTEKTRLAPLLLEEELWFPADPEKLFREKGTLVEPWRGTVSDIREALASGAKVLCWIRKPWQREKANAEFTNSFSFVDLPAYGVPGLKEVLPLAAASVAGRIEPDKGSLAAGLAESESIQPRASDDHDPVMRPVEGGVFVLGGKAPVYCDAENRSLPEHDVEVSPFWMEKTEVGNGEFAGFLNEGVAEGRLLAGVDVNGECVVRAIVSNEAGPVVCRLDPDGVSTHLLWTPANTNRPFAARTREGAGMERHPVVGVSWHGAALFCNWRSERAGLEPFYRPATNENWPIESGSKGFRLPTEAEWEAAACWDGSRKRVFAFGDTWDPARCNNEETMDGDRASSGPATVGVSSYGPGDPSHDGSSPSRILNLTGNAWEWCQDWFGDYPQATRTNPSGPSTGTIKVVRGGAFNSGPDTSWVVYRGIAPPSVCHPTIGFRTARGGI